MATDYQAMIDAIDAAILDGASKPLTLTIRGRSVTYRTLDELIRARQVFITLLRSAAGGAAYQMQLIEKGDPI